MTDKKAFDVWFAEKADTGYMLRLESILWFTWQAACAWQRERDEAICAEFSQDAYARYRASRREYDDGLLRAANALADKIRSGE